jgi:hypothetical protein
MPPRRGGGGRTKPAMREPPLATGGGGEEREVGPGDFAFPEALEPSVDSDWRAVPAQRADAQHIIEILTEDEEVGEGHEGEFSKNLLRRMHLQGPRPPPSTATLSRITEWAAAHPPVARGRHGRGIWATRGCGSLSAALQRDALPLHRVPDRRGRPHPQPVEPGGAGPPTLSSPPLPGTPAPAPAPSRAITPRSWSSASSPGAWRSWPTHST